MRRWFTDVTPEQMECTDPRIGAGGVDCTTSTYHLNQGYTCPNPDTDCWSGNHRFDESIIVVPVNDIGPTVNGGKYFQYTNFSFFPLNGKGFNDHITQSTWATASMGLNGGTTDLNYLFTTKLTFGFEYRGGEEFEFLGDDGECTQTRIRACWFHPSLIPR